MASKKILTHPKVRKLQRTLYQQAKKKPEWRAWSLYADLCRKEFIEEAMSRVLKNAGGSGVDGYTVEEMNENWEQFRDELQESLQQKKYKPSAVRRVLIPKGGGKHRALGIPTVKDRVVQTILMLLLEPIFEADFHDESYGYRPEKKAYDGIDSLCRQLHFGKTKVIEADLSNYFDTLDHTRVMELIAKRVSDGAILALIKAILTAPIVEEGEDGKKKHHKSTEGVPQGGVISPLLANLYLDALDKGVNRFAPSKVKMVRYADDFVIACHPGYETEVLRRLEVWLERAGLKLNREKTKMTDIAEGGSIEFLGFVLNQRVSTRGKLYIHRQPSQKSLNTYREKIRGKLNHWTLWQKPENAVREVNQITRGWGNYFHQGNSMKPLSDMNYWLEQRMRRWIVKKYRIRSRCIYSAFPKELLEHELGLYMLPTHPRWMTTKA